MGRGARRDSRNRGGMNLNVYLLSLPAAILDDRNPVVGREGRRGGAKSTDISEYQFIVLVANTLSCPK
jgi:hypothetical protein